VTFRSSVNVPSFLVMDNVMDLATGSTSGMPDGAQDTGGSITDRAVTARAEMLAAALRDLDTFDRARMSPPHTATVDQGFTVLPPVAIKPTPLSSGIVGASPFASQPAPPADPFRAAWRNLAKKETHVLTAPVAVAESIEAFVQTGGGSVPEPSDSVAEWSPPEGSSAAWEPVTAIAAETATESAPLVGAPLTWAAPAPAAVMPESAFGGYPQQQQFVPQQFAPQQFVPQQFAPQMPPGGFGANGGYGVPPMPAPKKPNWALRLVAVFAVLIVVGGIGMVAAVSILSNKVKSSFTSISNTLPGFDDPSTSPSGSGASGAPSIGGTDTVTNVEGTFDATGYLTGTLAPATGTCGWNNEGSGTFQLASCSATHNAKVLRASTFTNVSKTTEDNFLKDCSTEMSGWTAADQGDGQVWRIKFDRADGSNLQVCFVRYPS
jgi:hypothetical protein